MHWFGTTQDLHSVGGLVPLLGYLRNSNASIRGKAAEVVSTVVQNNPRSQQLVMEASGFEPLLLNFTSDPDITVRTKALGAISCKHFISLLSSFSDIRKCAILGTRFLLFEQIYCKKQYLDV